MAYLRLRKKYPYAASMVTMVEIVPKGISGTACHDIALIDRKGSEDGPPIGPSE